MLLHRRRVPRRPGVGVDDIPRVPDAVAHAVFPHGRRDRLVVVSVRRRALQHGEASSSDRARDADVRRVHSLEEHISADRVAQPVELLRVLRDLWGRVRVAKSRRLRYESDMIDGSEAGEATAGCRCREELF